MMLEKLTAISFTLWVALGIYLDWHANRNDMPFAKWSRRLNFLAWLFVAPAICAVAWCLFAMWAKALN